MVGRSALLHLVVVALVAGLGLVLSRMLDQRIGTGVVTISVIEQAARIAGLVVRDAEVAEVLLLLVGMTISSFALHLAWDPRVQESPEALVGGLILLLTVGVWRVIYAFLPR